MGEKCVVCGGTGVYIPLTDLDKREDCRACDGSGIASYNESPEGNDA